MIGSFDRIGYRRHARSFRAADLDVRLDGRRCLVTGGNAGLGRCTAQMLAERGARVHLLCRNAGRAEAARDELRRLTGNPEVHADVLDVSDLASIRRYVAAADDAPVDVLVHNAGLLPAERTVTADGLELTFATHVAGPHLLTRLLASRLRASADARVIFVSSGGMYTQRLSLDDVGWERRPYDGVRAYAQTKRMQVVLARAWAAPFTGSPVSGYAMHPGWADTGGVQTSLPRFHQVTRTILRTPEEGADTIAWLAIRQPPPPSGRFWFDRAEVSEHYLPWTHATEEEERRFWAHCDTIVGDQSG